MRPALTPCSRHASRIQLVASPLLVPVLSQPGADRYGQFASSVPGAECATVVCGILDPGTGQLTYSSAAHPPGIVVHPDGRIVLLDGGRSLPLAIRQDAARTEAAYALPPRSTLLLYTDGLVERRDGRSPTA